MELKMKKVKTCKTVNTTKRLLLDKELKQVGGGIPTPERMFHIRNVYEFISRGSDHHQP